MKIKKIYFDLDGVLADFDRGVRELCGMEPIDQSNKNQGDDDRLFEAIKNVDHFYNKLELCPGAKEMFQQFDKEYPGACEILSGIPKPRRGITTAADDKIEWVHRNLGEHVKVNIVYREEKKNYVTGRDCILIDDYEKNIQEWENAGGAGILFYSPKDALIQFSKLGTVFNELLDCDMARLKVVCVGAGGKNAVNSMINAGIKDVEFISVDFDPSLSLASKHITLGNNTDRVLTKNCPEECAKAADERCEEIIWALKEADMVIIVAGMGGATGSGVAQIVAKCSKMIGAFTVGVVICPFSCEGDKRSERARNGIKNLRNIVDSILVIPNEKIDNISQSTSFMDKFKEIDTIIRHGVRSICDICHGNGFVGVDFQDFTELIGNNKFAYLGIGEATGSNAPLMAFNEAINSPFIEVPLSEAKGVIVHFICGDASQFNLPELNEICMRIEKYVHPDAHYMWSGVVDDTMGEKIRAIVVVASQCRDYS